MGSELQPVQIDLALAKLTFDQALDMNLLYDKIPVAYFFAVSRQVFLRQRLLGDLWLQARVASVWPHSSFPSSTIIISR
jgi:hypothetical protein